MTARALILGFLLSVLVALVVPINDWYFRNTFFYSQHLPIGVLFLVIAFGTVINPILGRFRLARRELLVVVGMLFILGGVASSGLNRVFATTIAGPARKLSTGTDLVAYVGKDGSLSLPQGPYLGIEDGHHPDVDDPEFRYAIDGFWSGLGSDAPSVRHRSTVTWTDEAGQTRTQEAREVDVRDGDLDLNVPPGRWLSGRRAGQSIPGDHGGELAVVDVETPSIPWSRWAMALLHWAPILLPAIVCFLAMGALVRRQWMEHERLPYPIVSVINDLLADPQPGKRYADLFRQRSFWIAGGIVVFVLMTQLLASFGLNPLPIPTTLELGGTFRGDPWNKVWHHGGLFTWRIYFSIIALTFLLPPYLGFSLWGGWVLMCVVPAFLKTAGVPVGWNNPSQVAVGGYAVMCLLILWIGRVFYFRVLATAFGLRKDPTLREEAVFCWAFLLGFVGLIGGMMWYGAWLSHAFIAACVYLGTGLVLARLIAEAGLPYVNSPTWWTNAPVIFSLTGFAAPLAALAPLGMLAQTLCADPREHLAGFAVNAEAMGAQAQAKRLPLSGIFLIVAAGGAILSLVAMLLIGYHGAAMTRLTDQFHVSSMMACFDLPGKAAQGGEPLAGNDVYTCYGIGAVLTGLLGLARLAWAWWPMHPIGLLVAPTYATSMIWFSFFLGWLWKVGVMRYGGIRIYRACRPIALGLLAGEAVMVALTLIIGLIAGVMDWSIPVMPRFLPG